MSSAPPIKLTKKQKKGLAFRERKQGKQPKNKSNHGQSGRDETGLEVPVEENQDLASLQVHSMEVQGLACAPISISKVDGGKGKGKAKDTGDKEVSVKPKKRKREEGDANGVESDGPRSKKKKGASGNVADESVVKTAPQKKRETNEGKQRFILFVGEFFVMTNSNGIEGVIYQEILNILPAKMRSKSTLLLVVCLDLHNKITRNSL